MSEQRRASVRWIARVIRARLPCLTVVECREVDVKCRRTTRCMISSGDEEAIRCTGRGGRAESRRSARPNTLLVQASTGHFSHLVSRRRI